MTHFFQTNSIARAVLQIAINIGLTVLMGVNVVAAAAISAAVVTGLSGGNLGDIIKAGAIAAMSTFAFGELAKATPLAAMPFNSGFFDPVQYAGNIGGSAIIGCASSVVSGGSCGSGAASAAAAAAMMPLTSTFFPHAQSNFGQRVGGTIMQATAGGLASIAGGGKFANGAVTAGFQYLARLSLEDWRNANAAEAPCYRDINFPGCGSKGGESAFGGGGAIPVPRFVYREGRASPSNLTPRPQDEGGLSTRDSISNPIVNGQGQSISAGSRPVMRPGENYIEIDTAKLPPGSVIVDGYPYGNMPAGHVTIRASPEQINGAITEKGKFPK